MAAMRILIFVIEKIRPLGPEERKADMYELEKPYLFRILYSSCLSSAVPFIVLLFLSLCLWLISFISLIYIFLFSRLLYYVHFIFLR